MALNTNLVIHGPSSNGRKFYLEGTGCNVSVTISGATCSFTASSTYYNHWI